MRYGKRLSRKFLFVGVVLPALLVGCTTAPEGPSGQPTARITGSGDAVILEDPFAGLLRKQAESEEQGIHDAIEQATARCMRDKGFTYTPAPLQKTSFDTRRLGDLEYASVNGFGTVKRALEKNPPQEKGKDLENLSPEQQEAFSIALGGPYIPGERPESVDANDPNLVVVRFPKGSSILDRRGCINIARTEVTGDLEGWAKGTTLLDTLRNKALVAIRSDPRLVEATRAWTKCMATEGFGEKTKQEHRDYIVDKLGPDGSKTQAQMDEILKEEIRIATASARCDLQANLGPIERDVQAEHEKRLTDENQGAIIALAELNKSSVQRAKEYLKKK